MELALLKHYQDFIERVNELGFLPFSNIYPGLPSLHGETPKSIWYTRDPDTDPSYWKDCVSGEKKLAYGSIIGGNKGFVSERMYANFYAAYHIETSMKERWESGQVNEMTWKLWNMFEENSIYSTTELRKILGVTTKKGGSRLDKSLTDLQHCFYITISRTEQRTDKNGKSYGSPQNVYEKVTSWVPQGWLEDAKISKEEARKFIIETAVSMGQNISPAEVEKLMFK